MTSPVAPPAADDGRHGGVAARTRWPDPAALEIGAGVGAAGLALTSTGSMVVAAVFLGVATRARWSLAALLLATASVAVRFSTVTFDDVAGIQSVLGSAGLIGPATAAASAWAAAAAVLMAVRVTPGRTNALRCVVALAGGGMAAAIAAGPGPGGDIGQRVAATAVATVVGFVLVSTDHRPGLARVRAVAAVVAGLASVALASWPS